jgi:hypothetical protein
MPSVSYFLIDLIAPCAAEGSEAGQVSNILATSRRDMAVSDALRDRHWLGRNEKSRGV